MSKNEWMKGGRSLLVGCQNGGRRVRPGFGELLFDIPLGIQSWIKEGSRLVLHLAVRMVWGGKGVSDVWCDDAVVLQGKERKGKERKGGSLRGEKLAVHPRRLSPKNHQ